MTYLATLMFKRMATSELSDNFSEGGGDDNDDDGDSSSHDSEEVIRRTSPDDAKVSCPRIATDSMIAESGSR